MGEDGLRCLTALCSSPGSASASVLMLISPAGLYAANSGVSGAEAAGRLATLLLSSSVNTQEVFMPAALHFWKFCLFSLEQTSI